MISPTDTAVAERNGRYSVTVDSTGIWFLLYSGVNHVSHRVAVCIEKPEHLLIDVRLRAYPYLDSISSPGIEGKFNHYNINDPVPMQRQSDGTFEADVNTGGDSILYEIVGITKDFHTVNGTESDGYVIDNSGDYWSVLKPKNGVARIVFDPAKLVRSNIPAKVSFADPGSACARFSDVYAEMQTENSEFQNAVISYKDSGKDLTRFRYDWSADLRRLDAAIGKEKNGMVLREMYLNYADLAMMHANVDYRQLDKAVVEIPASSDIWELQPSLYINLLIRVGMTGTQYEKYIDRFIRENPSPAAKSEILFMSFESASYSKDEQRAEKYYDTLVNEYPDTPFGRRAKEYYAAAEALRTGNAAPAFSVASLTDSSVAYTNASFKGKYCLIDFWSTWCGPCVAEMKYVGSAYEKFKNDDFTVLGVSMDVSPEDAVSFIRNNAPMPWYQAFAPVSWDNRMVRAFGITAIPDPVLIDPAGKIVASGEELTGWSLNATLERILGKSARK